MQREFNNRIAAQRSILRVVNRKRWQKEPLFGLSSKAIARWSTANQIDPNSHLVRLAKEVSEKLFFLANKSQEQITEEYSAARAEIVTACEAISHEIDQQV